MTQEAVVNKVVNLLNLARDRSNDAESKSALLFAQKLMAKYNISEDQVCEQSEKEIELVNLKCDHKDNKGFRLNLAEVISKNFRTKCYLDNKTIVFYGQKVDAIIAKRAFEFAYKHIVRRGTYHEDKARAEYGTAKYVFNSYASGYLEGLKEALEEQSVALMIITPKRVEDEFNELTKNAREFSGGMRGNRLYRDIYDQGNKDAKEHFSKKKLKA